MADDIDQEVAELRQLCVAQLRARHQQLSGQPSRSGNKDHLVRRIAWWLQAMAEGGLSDHALQRAKELATDPALLATPLPSPKKPATNTAATYRDPRLPPPGTLLVRGYRGQTLQVKVLSEGFEYDNQIYRSLTAVAKQITGKHWNGFHFFALDKESKQA